MLTFYSFGISYATTFSSEDLVGHWSGSFMETTESNDTRVSRDVHVAIAPTDYTVSGTWSDKGYADNILYSGTITDGSVDITAKGELTPLKFVWSLISYKQHSYRHQGRSSAINSNYCNVIVCTIV